MESARALSIALLGWLAMAPAVLAQTAERRSSASAGPAQVTRLPIQGLDRIVQPDGSVVYLSTDRRFVFRGEMTDLWTGTDVGVTPPTQRIDLARNGVRLDGISVAVGSAGPWMTVFVAPECAPCVELVRDALRLSASRRARFRLVLLDSSTAGAHANRLIWCAKDKVEALRSVYLDGKAPASFARPGDACDQFGLYQAKEAAKLFGVAQLPLIVDAAGLGHVGLPDSLESLLPVRNDP